MDAVAFETAVPQDFPVLQLGQGVFHLCSGPAVDSVFRFLPRAEALLTLASAVRDEQASALVAAGGDAGIADHGLQYVTRFTGVGHEHFFDKSVFACSSSTDLEPQ